MGLTIAFFWYFGKLWGSDPSLNISFGSKGYQEKMYFLSIAFERKLELSNSN